MRCEIQIRAYRSVFLLVGSLHALAGQFPSFAHCHESGTESESDHGAEEEASSVECNDDIDPLVWGGWYGLGHDVMDQMRDEGFASQRVTEDWQDVTKVYTLERSQWGAIRGRSTLRTFFGKSEWILKKDLMYSMSDISTGADRWHS